MTAMVASASDSAKFCPPPRRAEREGSTLLYRKRLAAKRLSKIPTLQRNRNSMKIHEYQAKAILAKYKVPVPRGEVAFTVAEVDTAAKKLGGSVVVKAQIHAGGRGKGGGVKVAKFRGRRGAIAEKMLGMTLVTHQTGPEGRVVQRLLVEETLPIDSASCIWASCSTARPECRFSWHPRRAAWRSRKSPRKLPEQILKEILDPGTGLQPLSGAQAGVRHRHSGPAIECGARPR